MDALDLGEVMHAFNNVPCNVAVVLQEELRHEYRLHIASCLNDIWVWYNLRTLPPFCYCAYILRILGWPEKLVTQAKVFLCGS